MKRGHVEEAKALMRKLHGGQDGASVEATIESEIAGMEGGKDDDRKGNASWGEVGENGTWSSHRWLHV